MMSAADGGHPARLKLDAHAKLNLFLRVLAREESGYHSIETLLIRLSLADEVRLETSRKGGVRITVTGDASVPTDSTNLCVRAAEGMIRETGYDGGVEIGLVKRIPVGAGLGGGSADAATVLLGLQALLGDPLGPGALYRLAGELGSDVPFGLIDSPMALAWERGRRLLPLAAPHPLPVAIVVPSFPIAAGDAYGWLVEDRASGLASAPGPAGLPAPGLLTDLETIVASAANDLEDPVFRRHPGLREIRDALQEKGARVALLCGSGSCVAGVFETEAARDRAVRSFESAGVFPVVSTATLS